MHKSLKGAVWYAASFAFDIPLWTGMVHGSNPQWEFATCGVVCDAIAVVYFIQGMRSDLRKRHW